MQSMEPNSDCWVDRMHTTKLNYPVYGWLSLNGHGFLEMESPACSTRPEKVARIAARVATVPSAPAVDLEALSRAADAAFRSAASTVAMLSGSQLTINLESGSDSGSRSVCLRASTTWNPQVALRATRCVLGHRSSAADQRTDQTGGVRGPCAPAPVTTGRVASEPRVYSSSKAGPSRSCFHPGSSSGATSSWTDPDYWHARLALPCSVPK